MCTRLPPCGTEAMHWVQCCYFTHILISHTISGLYPPCWPVTPAPLRGSCRHQAANTLCCNVSLFNCLIGLVIFLSAVLWRMAAERGDVCAFVRLCVFTCHASVHLWQEDCLLAAGNPALLCTCISNCDLAGQPWHRTERPYLNSTFASMACRHCATDSK